MQLGSQPSQVQKRLSEAVASFTQRWQLCQAAGPSPGCLCQIWLPQIGTDGSTSLYTQARVLQGWSRDAGAAPRAMGMRCLSRHLRHRLHIRQKPHDQAKPQYVAAALPVARETGC